MERDILWLLVALVVHPTNNFRSNLAYATARW